MAATSDMQAKTKQMKRQSKQTKQATSKNNQVSSEDTSIIPATEVLNIDDCFKVIDLYFKQKNVMYSHLYNSFDKFIDEDVRSLLENGSNVFFEKVTKDKLYRYKFRYTNIAIKPPILDTKDEIMFPSQARLRDLTYSSRLVATITQLQETVDIATGTVTERIIGDPEEEYPVAGIPIMVRSKYCALNLKKGHDKSECEYDPGGYFIINGNEKAVMSLESMIDNKPMVTVKKDGSGLIYTVQVNSKSDNNGDMLQMVSVRMKKDNIMNLRVPILSEFPVLILLRALGVESDRDIINMCVYNDRDTEMTNLIRISLDNCVVEGTNVRIRSKEDAMEYLTKKMRVMKNYSPTDKDVRLKEKKIHLESLLKNNFLPHVNSDLKEKALYLGYMINRLLMVVIGRIPVDDRDSFVNKRIKLPGPLMFDLFKQHYNKMLNECNKFFKKRNNDDENPLNVINQIKLGTIEQGLKAALLKGVWNKHVGVSQKLERATYLQTISTLRRVVSPSMDASHNKLTGPRHLHNTSVNFLCYIQTPEGGKVGLVKSLALMAGVTIGMKSQVYIIKRYLKDKLVSLHDLSPGDLKDLTRVFLNGEWLGMTKTADKLYQALHSMKLNGTINANTSVCREIKSDVEFKEIKIYTDGGRLFRPFFKVDENNKLLITKKHLDTISLDGEKSTTVSTTWNEFMAKNPGVLEYVDVDECANSMVAMYPMDVVKMRQRMLDSSKLATKINLKSNHNIVNRYDNFVYSKYNFCELHPSMMLGEVVSNIPFCNHNQAPRNIFQFSQAKQALGIYASNYRHRLDISYLMYHAQKPIVTTRAMKYINTDKLVAGENCVVAIACYGGWNQEDSVIMNQSAVDRGLLRATHYKSHTTVIQKNQSTSQDDVFLKPDREKVMGMRYGSYDKLNEQGYAPEETVVEDKDIIIGKVSPIPPTGTNNKIYKDNSEMYKSVTPGVVDKVWTNILNHEGYEMRKMRIRSERIPIIGDKFCSRHGQKGTIGITLPAADMPFTAAGIQPDIIMNPNAVPSRMTIAQLIECILGKVSAIEGHESDGTPFNYPDIEAIKKQLESLGFKGDGTEYLYNGMTGKRMKVMIFQGPTYYQRLRHMVNHKIHSRARGPVTILTRNAPEGRSRDGGLRFGEMERDSMIAHGMGRFLKERLMETADAYDTHVCGSCGLFAQRMLKRDNKRYATGQDIYFCPGCRNKTNVYKIRIPYAFKLMMQELMAMNIAPRMRIKEDKYVARLDE